MRRCRMFKAIIRNAYHIIHFLLFKGFVVCKGKHVKTGHISSEHLEHPELDEKLLQGLNEIGITTRQFTIDKKGYYDYLKQASYPESYYGGGLDPGQNFTEKTLEHYVSLKYLDLTKDAVFIDMAACSSPFYQIVTRTLGIEQVYQQDLIFPKGVHGDQIGGYASAIPFADNSVDAVTLHCSLEHFEGTSDIEFFQEMQRVLKPGGRIIILPFYIAYEYTIHVDPAFNLIKFHKPKVDSAASLRYCDWFQYFSRHYDVKTLKERILDKVPGLELEVFKVTNFREIHPSTYLRFVAVFTKM
ncbi:methyltransferase domain-containing protein [Bacteroidota bacterium]